MKKRNLRKEAKYALSEQFLNKAQLESSKICGCPVCLLLFSPTLIKEWCHEIGATGTALCPYCSGDTVVPESEDYTLDMELLKILQKEDFKKINKLYKKIVKQKKKLDKEKIKNIN